MFSLFLPGVSREQLAELVSLRRRLLHELPRIRTQVRRKPSPGLYICQPNFAF